MLPSHAPAPAGSSSTGPVFDIQSLSFGYEPTQPLLQDITVALHPARITVLLGPNAAGKTTLLRLMLGQLTPWNGHIHLHGQPVRTLSPTQRARRISYVPQRGATSFSFTVRQIVEMGCFAHHHADRTALDLALDLTDLAAVQHRIFAHLSGGQQQRVLIARAIAQAHDTGQAMLLDEPANSMDLRHIHRTMHILGQLAQRGLGVLVVLHDLNLAAQYADDVWLLDHGSLVDTGPWQQVLDPARLEPIYGVSLRPLSPPGCERPVFFVPPVDTLM